MKRHARRYAMVLGLMGSLFAAFDAAALFDGPSMFMLQEPESRGQSGNYFLAKGEEEFRRGNFASAKARWELSAYWGQKIAQYNLGLMYFKGIGVAQDRARAVAWFALAAERHDPPFRDALEWSYTQLDANEIARANDVWRDELKPRYGDAVAMPRAMALWRRDSLLTTGSHLGYVIGTLTVYTSSTQEDGMQRQRAMRAKGGPYENPLYPRVEVGDLRPLE